jgi:hypothetical protein
MIVGFDLERDGVALAYVDNPGVLSGTDQNTIAAGRQFLQVQA